MVSNYFTSKKKKYQSPNVCTSPPTPEPTPEPPPTPEEPMDRFWYPILNTATGTGVQSIGYQTLGFTGTATRILNNRAAFNRYSSSLSANSNAGLTGAGGIWLPDSRLAWKPIFHFQFEFPTDADFNSAVRAWIGLGSALLVDADTLNNKSGIAIRVSSTAGDTTWKIGHNDGGAVAPAVIDTTLAVAAATLYDLKIDATDPTAVKISINGVLYTTITTDLPAISTELGPLMGSRNTTTTPKNFSAALISMETP